MRRFFFAQNHMTIAFLIILSDGPGSSPLPCKDTRGVQLMGAPVRTRTKGQGIVPLTKRKAWKALQTHYKAVQEVHLRKLFADDPQRGERMTAEGAGLFLDYSKNRITDETVRLLVQLAEESGLRTRIDATLRGEKINVTEKRAVLHVALRAPKDESILLDGENVVPEVHAVLAKMADF